MILAWVGALGLALDLALVRDVLLPGMTLTPGRAMMARVVSADEGSGGSLAIAGYLLDAELPRGLAAGTSLRLIVRDVDAERVLLTVAPHEQSAPAEPAAQPPPPLGVPVPLPGGAQLRVLPDGEDGGGGAPAGTEGSVRLSLDLPGLGTLELRLALDPGTVRAAITAEPGDPATRAQAHAGELRDALSRTLERTAAVTVTTRREPLDLYA